MTTTTQPRSSESSLSKVPEVTIYFWIIKILCTTVGETAADFLNVNLNLGLTGTSVVTGVLLVIALVLQFSAHRYVPVRYWVAVALISVFGTLVTDNLTDKVGLPLEASTLIFAALLTATFIGWYLIERTLSIHSIYTRRREAFYWLAILFTFALGTAAGDLMAEVLGLGYLVSGLIVVSLIAITAVAWRLGLNAVLAFWIAYILTRPLGASIGDYLSQPAAQGGLGLGVTLTSVIFFGGIIGIVLYLSVSKADVLTQTPRSYDDAEGSGALWQTLAVVAIVLLVGTTGYFWRKAAVQDDTSADPPAATESAPGGSSGPTARSPLGDMRAFRVIVQDTLDKLNAGDQSGATERISDLETAWDNSEARLKPKNGAAWTEVDGKIDTVLRELRARNANPSTEQESLNALLVVL